MKVKSLDKQTVKGFPEIACLEVPERQRFFCMTINGLERSETCVCVPLLRNQSEEGRERWTALSWHSVFPFFVVCVFVYHFCNHVNTGRGKEEDSGAECLFIAALELGGD